MFAFGASVRRNRPAERLDRKAR